MSFFSRKTVIVYLALAAFIVASLGVLGVRIVEEQRSAVSASLRQDVPDLIDHAAGHVTALQNGLIDLVLDNGRTAPEDIQSAFRDIETIGARLISTTAVATAPFDPELDNAIIDFTGAIRRGAPLLADLTDNTRLEVARRHFQDVGARLETLRQCGARYAARMVHAAQNVILHRFTTFVTIAFGLIVVVGLLLLTLSRQIVLLNGSNQRALSLTRHLTAIREDLEQASLALERSNAELAEQNHRLRHNERILEERNYQFNAALDNMLEGLAMVAADGTLTIANRRLFDVYGLDAARLRPAPSLRSFLRELTDAGRLASADAIGLLDRCTLDAATHGPRTFDLRLDGGATIIEVHERPLAHGGWLFTHEDVTERRQAHRHVQHLASHDPLTGLPNRAHFNEALLAAMTDRAAEVAIVLLDLDRFKSVNDLYGHGAGDRLLEILAERLRHDLGADCLAARLGGDEFALLIRGGDVRLQAQILGERVVQAVRAPFDVGVASIEIGISAGIAITPDDGADARTLQRNADIALYAVKSQRLNSFRFFDAEMSASLERRHTLEGELRAAIASGTLSLHYQPIVAAETARIVGAEALLRWTSPTRGPVAADQIVAIAEECGLMVALGDWILCEAIAAAALWPEHLAIAVNLSARQFRNSGLVETVVEALERNSFSPRRLQLEVTETVLCEDDAGTAMAMLRASGVRLSLDDFGTGYASLAYLTRFPFDRIKIDKSFVRHAAERTDCRAIIDAVCGLAKSLGLDTVAEGIETERELAIIRAAGCGYAQGYYFGRPLAAADFLALVGRQDSVRHLPALVVRSRATT